MPNVKRDFKVILGKIGPIIVSLIYLGVIVSWLILEPGSMQLLGKMMSLIIFGIPIYLLLIFFYNPDAIVAFSNSFAYLNLWLENFLLPRRIREHITHFFHDLEHKSVLEFGSGVGTLTLQLAKKVGPAGRIYATDLSGKNVSILKKRLSKKGILHVNPIHDQHQVNRVHPDVHDVDVIFSVGMMSYMQDFKKILSQMHRLLPNGGKIMFVEYVNFFWFLPDAEWMSNMEKLKTVFREAGFSIRIEKKKGFLWNYLFVYGIKTDRDVPLI